MAVSHVEFKTKEASVSAFQAGYIDGRSANLRKERLTPYLRVGLDEYAQGFRTGFFARGKLGSMTGDVSSLRASATATPPKRSSL